MSATGPGSKFGAEFPAEHDDDKPIMTDNEYTRGILDGYAIKKIAQGKSPAPASPPSRKTLRIVLEHNRGMRDELRAGALNQSDIDSVIAYNYLDGFVKGLEYALGIKPLK